MFNTIFCMRLLRSSSSSAPPAPLPPSPPPPPPQPARPPPTAPAPRKGMLSSVKKVFRPFVEGGKECGWRGSRLPVGGRLNRGSRAGRTHRRRADSVKP